MAVTTIAPPPPRDLERIWTAREITLARLYLAGNKGRTLVLLRVDLRDGSVEETTVPALVPSKLGLLSDGLPVTGVANHALAAKHPDHEYIIPDGIAIAHGYVIVTTTAGRVLAFK
jgi:hypothetical protein